MQLEWIDILPAGPGRDQTLQEAIARWQACCKPILKNCITDRPDDEVLSFLQKGAEWPWNEGLSHIEFIEREYRAAVQRDRIWSERRGTKTG